MSKIKAIINNYISSISLILGVFIMTVVSTLASLESIRESVYFFVFQTFCVIIPGTAINRLMHIKELNRMENALVSYVWGYILSIVVYFITVPFGIGKVIQYIYIYIYMFGFGCCTSDTY
jgi:lysylphosphatidylglycerol synthetase-like protein (DUF2156 family)